MARESLPSSKGASRVARGHTLTTQSNVGNEAKKPGVIRFLQSKGVGDNAIVANMLIAAADRYYSRRK